MAAAPSTPLADGLIDFALDTHVRDLPAACVDATRRLILDTTGCALGGLGTAGGERLARMKRDAGGTAEATLYASGIKLPAAAVSYVLSQSANALDADECLHFRTHFACCIVPTTLAFAERQGSSGRDTLAAITIGFDIAARVSLALPFYTVTPAGDIAVTPIQGYSASVFGIVAALARLLGLDRAQTRHAFGIAFAAAPTQRPHWLACTSMTKYAFFGAIAEAAANAVLLAQAGFTGDIEVLEPHREFWRGLGAERCDTVSITANLGGRWYVEETSYKLYPAARPLCVIIDLFAAIVNEQDLAPADIEEVIVRLPPCRQVREFAARTEPGNIEDAAMSAAFAMTMIATRIPPGPRWADPAHLKDSTLRALMRRMRAEAVPSWQKTLADQVQATGTYLCVPTEVTVRARGQQWTAHGERPRGDPGATAASDDELRDKFRRLAEGRLSAAAMEQALRAIDDLPGADNVQELMRALA